MSNYTPTNIVSAYLNGDITKPKAKAHIMSAMQSALMVNNDMELAQAWMQAQTTLDNTNKAPAPEPITVEPYLDLMAERVIIAREMIAQIAACEYVPTDMPEELAAEYAERINERIATLTLDESDPRVAAARKRIGEALMRPLKVNVHRRPNSNGERGNRRGKLARHVTELVERYGDELEIGQEYEIAWIRRDHTSEYTEAEVFPTVPGIEPLPRNSTAVASLKSGKFPYFELACDENGRNQRLRYTGEEGTSDE